MLDSFSHTHTHTRHTNTHTHAWIVKKGRTNRQTKNETECI